MGSLPRKMMTAVEIAAPPPSPSLAQRSPWHSPVPYLFGGLAAMLGLIAFALLILACSYWKLSGSFDSEVERDSEAGERNCDSNGEHNAPPVLEEKFLVIMAGQEKPTFLATPMSSRASSFGSTSNSSCSSESQTSEKSNEEKEKQKQRTESQLEMVNVETQQTTEQVP